jgi:hypothetical protein
MMEDIYYDGASPRFDEEEGEEEEEAEAPVEPIEDVGSNEPELSFFEKGIAFPKDLNGSNVRVGIIMARWNADIIQGLYKV